MYREMISFAYVRYEDVNMRMSRINVGNTISMLYMKNVLSACSNVALKKGNGSLAGVWSAENLRKSPIDQMKSLSNREHNPRRQPNSTWVVVSLRFPKDATVRTKNR